MANFCPNCGNSVNSSDAYCANCGCALNAADTAAATTDATATASSSGSGVAKGVVGTLVAVTLLNGLTRNLYYYGGRYYMDPYCRNPYMGGMIGRPRPVGGRPMGGPRGGMGGPRGGGPRGGMGGPHGGGPRGGGPGGGRR